MFNKSIKIIIILLIFSCGAALVALSLYSQANISSELRVYNISIFDAIKYNVRFFLWWHTVGIPFLIGLIFINSSIMIKRHKINSKKSKNLVRILIIISLVATPLIIFEGLFCVLISTTCLLLQKLNEKHNNSLNRIGAQNAPSG